MARTNNLTNFLTDVASAIKTKTGDSSSIPASDFDTEILSIETGGNYQSKTLNVTQNGNYNLLPDQEFDALSNVNISVSVSPILQNKTVTENGSYTADQNYDGLGTVIVNVPSSQINNQDKTVTENGIYTADSGYTGLGTVTVNVDVSTVDYQIYTAAYIAQDSTVQRDMAQYSNYKQIEIDLLPYINRTIIITNTGDRNFYGFTSVKPEDDVALNNPRQSTSGGLTYKYTGGNDRYLVYDFTASNQSDSVIRVELASVELIEKNIIANGVYDAEDDDADGFSKVTVNVPQTGIKRFDTEQAMQADPNPSEGDLAVVYRNEIQPVQEDSEFSSCIFPNEVVLDEAFSGNIDGSFGSTGGSDFEGYAELSSSRFKFDGFGETRVRVQYTSQDGITYTRTDGGEELQEFGTTIKWESGGDPFNNVIGNFMKIGGNYFEGLYEYVLNQPVDSFKLREQNSNNYNLVAQNNPGMDTFYSGETIFCGKNVGNKLREIIDLGVRGFLYLSQDLSVAYFVPTGYQNMYIYNNRWAPLVFNSSQTPTDVTYYSYDLTNMSRTEVVVSVANLGVVTYGKVLDLPANSYYLLGLVNSSDTYYYWNVSNNLYSQLYKVGSGTEIEYENKYIIASTQLDATSDYVYGKYFLRKKWN